MRLLIAFLFAFLVASIALSDTPPPNTVKAKTYSGDGNTAITATGTALDVNVVGGGGGGGLVDQGEAGVESWLMSVTSSALPANACQENGGHLASIDTKLTSPLTVSGMLSVSGSTVTANAGTGTFIVNGSGFTQPVSGTFWQATQPVSVSGSIPAGGNTIGSVGIVGTVPVTVGNTVSVSGTITTSNSANGNTGDPVPTQATQIAGSDGTDLITFKVSSLGVLSVDGSASTQPISASSLPLPLGAATEATLSTLNGKIPSGLTVSSTRLLVDGSGVTQPVSGTVSVTGSTVSVNGSISVSGSTVTANAGTGTFIVDASGFTVPVSGTFWQATQPVSGPLTDAQLRASPVPVSGTFWQATQPVSGTISVSGSTISIDSIAGTISVDASGSTVPVSGTFWQATQPVSGPLTDAQLRASPVAVSGTFWQATQPVSLSTLPALTTGSAIIGRVGIDQTTPGTTNGVQVNAALPAGTNVIGHVVVDSAPTTAVTQSGTWSTRTQDGSGNAITSTSNALDVNIAGGTVSLTASTVSIAGTVAATQSGTWTVQPGNTANTTPWLVSQSVRTPLTLKQAAISVGTSAVRLTTDGSAPSSTRVLLAAQLLVGSTANCYFGSSSVTSSSTGRGVQMMAGQTLSFNNDAADYYGICDQAAQTIFITEQE